MMLSNIYIIILQTNRLRLVSCCHVMGLAVVWPISDYIYPQTCHSLLGSLIRPVKTQDLFKDRLAAGGYARVRIKIHHTRLGVRGRALNSSHLQVGYRICANICAKNLWKHLNGRLNSPIEIKSLRFSDTFLFAKIALYRNYMSESHFKPVMYF